MPLNPDTADKLIELRIRKVIQDELINQENGRLLDFIDQRINVHQRLKLNYANEAIEAHVRIKHHISPEVVQRELNKQTTEPAHSSIMDECARNDQTWTAQEDKDLARELRQAITKIALNHQRSHHVIVCRIKDQHVIF